MFCPNRVSNIIRYTHTKTKEILITKMIYPCSLLSNNVKVLTLLDHIISVLLLKIHHHRNNTLWS